MLKGIRQTAMATVVLAAAVAFVRADPIVSWPQLKKTFVEHVQNDPTTRLTKSTVIFNRVNGKIWVCDADGVLSLLGQVSGGAGNYSLEFTGQTTVTLTHGLGTRDLLVLCYDDSEHAVEPDRIAVGSGPTYDVTVTFFVPQTGRCVVNGRS